MALPGRARSTGPVLLGLALVLLLGLAEARTIVSSSASSAPGHLRRAEQRIRRPDAEDEEPVPSGTTTYSTPVTANGTFASGKAILADPNAPIEWQALLRMQATWVYQYTSWTPLNPCSVWADITCTGGHVTAFAPEEDLISGLTTDFGTLSYLSYFYVADYYIGGILPSNVGNLKALTYFGFSQTTVSGIIPTSFGRCTLLDILNLSRNNLCGTIPSSLGNLVLLTYLFLHYNQLTSWSEIGNAGTMPNLGGLRVDNNLLPNFPTSFYKLVSLTYIGQLETLLCSLPSSLSKMTQLQEIRLQRNRLVGTLPSWIPTLPELTSIDMRFNYLTGPIGSPASTRNSFSRNYFTSGVCYTNNCQPGCSTQRANGACARFCGTDEPNGACGGLGTCVPGIPINRCLCNLGRRQVCANNQCTCV